MVDRIHRVVVVLRAPPPVVATAADRPGAEADAGDLEAGVTERGGSELCLLHLVLLSAHDLERERQRAAAGEKRCEVVPINVIRERIRGGARQAEVAELLAAPGPHKHVFGAALVEVVIVSWCRVHGVERSRTEGAPASPPATTCVQRWPRTGDPGWPRC